MITASMTAPDIAKEFDRHRERIDKWCDYRLVELRKWCIGHHVKSAWKTLTHEAYGLRYMVVLYYGGITKSGKVVLAFCNETNEWVEDVPVSYGMCTSTTHFFRRYAERALGDKEMALEKAAQYFVTRNAANICVYCKGDDFVYAVNDGIILCRLDRKRSILVRKTFVSMEMLRHTQKTAYDKIKDVLAHYEDKVRECARSGTSVTSVTIDSTYAHILMNEANDIYKQYFEK